MAAIGIAIGAAVVGQLVANELAEDVEVDTSEADAQALRQLNLTRDMSKRLKPFSDQTLQARKELSQFAQENPLQTAQYAESLRAGEQGIQDALKGLPPSLRNTLGNQISKNFQQNLADRAVNQQLASLQKLGSPSSASPYLQAGQQALGVGDSLGQLALLQGISYPSANNQAFSQLAGQAAQQGTQYLLNRAFNSGTAGAGV